MSGILECDGVFQVPVPDGWTVRGEAGRAYDLSHASQQVGVNISVYPRTALGPDIEEAVRRFAIHVGVEETELRVGVTDDDERQTRAFARFDADGRSWLVAVLFLGDAAVLATCNSSSDDPAAFATGEVVVASLGPVEPKRGLFRRR